jgi:hypothetical protein
MPISFNLAKLKNANASAGDARVDVARALALSYELFQVLNRAGAMAEVAKTDATTAIGDIEGVADAYAVAESEVAKALAALVTLENAAKTAQTRLAAGREVGARIVQQLEAAGK